MIYSIFLLIFVQISIISTQHFIDSSRVCPEGWKLWKNSCYYFSKTSRPWHHAEAVCRTLDKDSSLAEIETKEESDFLEKTIFENAYMNCYYDTIDRLLDGDFLDDPSNLTNEKCVQYCRDRGFSYAGTQYSRQCFCGDNLEKYPPRNKYECELKCTGNSHETCGGHWRLSVYLTAGTPHWLGGKCMPVHKEWQWFTSKKYINGYTDWNQERPCNKESCLDLNMVKDGKYQWNDENCLRRLNFICETPAKPRPELQETTTPEHKDDNVHSKGCIRSCKGVPNGDYQSCSRCDSFISCVYGSVVYRPCPYNLVWDDMAKECRFTSTTCII